MTRSQAQKGGCTDTVEPLGDAGKPSRSSHRGGGSRKSNSDSKASPSASGRCWQSGAKSKALPAADIFPSLPVGTSPKPAATNAIQGGRIPSGWAELPAAERASRREQLQEMGFTSSASQAALEDCNWDVNKALDQLFNGDGSKDSCNFPFNSQLTTQCSTGRAKPRNQARSQLQAPEVDARRQGADIIKASLGMNHASAAIKASLGIKPASAAGDSTSASGGSTPRRSAGPTSSDSPQQDVSSSIGDDVILVPPGLDDIPMFPTLLLAPPGLDLADESTLCPKAVADIWSSPPAPCHEPFDVLQPIAAIDRSVVPVLAAAPAVAESVVPKRSLQKVQHAWDCEDPASQMGVEEGTFVYVWADSKTETGWVYAESLICCNRAGWLPGSMLQQLPPNRLWMRVTAPCAATFPMQLQVEVGNMVLVDGSHAPVNGWVYAEHVASATGRPSLQGLLGAGGWVPIQCVEWTEV